MVVHYNLREQVLNAIGGRIISGELSPGDVLPKEDTLSEQYGVSRTVIREAVKGLAARGLVESRPKVGTIIRPRDDWQMLDPSVLEWVASSSPENEFMLSLAEVRLAIEPGMAGIAARNASEEDIGKITTAYEQLEAAVDDDEAWAKADLAFHASIVDACDNQFLTYIVRAIRKPLYSRRLINASLASMLDPEDVVEPYESVRDEVLSRHRAVVEAIRQKDEEAAELATDRLLKRVTELMRKEISK
ncbi:MAG: FadR/GntR family transcriptional regulator [Candidatus Promineifilaceae bacterium]|nr:FadR/GntR family transcriptional regulator [Candidatus Promineifilaceae bacterium]